MSLAPVTARRERIVEFDYLRGLAIGVIVLGHSIFLAQPLFPALLENLLRGGTGLFVFISGFFFHRVFAARFDYRDFVAKKAKALLIPFVFISLLALLIRAFGWWQDGLPWQQNLLNVWYTLRNGYVLYPHWYIPFILLTFCCAPLHMRFLQLHCRWQLLLLLAFSVVALFLHRPQSNNNFLQSLVYYTPFYLLGVLVSQYYARVHQWRGLLLLGSVLVVVVTALSQTYLWGHLGNYHKAAFSYEGLDLQFVQVLFACIALLLLCYHLHWRWLQQHLAWLAELSFPIFFIHPLLTIALENLVQTEAFKPFLPAANIQLSLAIFVATFIVQFYGSVVIAVVLRHTLGSDSKWLIG